MGVEQNSAFIYTLLSSTTIFLPFPWGKRIAHPLTSSCAFISQSVPLSTLLVVLFVKTIQTVARPGTCVWCDGDSLSEQPAFSTRRGGLEGSIGRARSGQGFDHGSPD